MLIVIQWRSGKEYVRINEDEVPNAGSCITTTEYWPDSGKTVEYEVSCHESNETPDGTLRLKLQYDQEKQKPNHPNIAWGTSTLEIKNWRVRENRKASARFVCPTLPKFTGEADFCEVISESLFADISLETLVRLARPRQNAMRQYLLREDRCCVISGETTKEVLEAAHIIDHAHKGISDTKNGILLRADLHRLFDQGILLIREDGNLEICRDTEDIGEKYHELVTTKKSLSPKVVRRIREALIQRNSINTKKP